MSLLARGRRESISVSFWEFVQNAREIPLLLWSPTIVALAIVFWQALRGELRLAGKGLVIVGVCLMTVLVSYFYLVQMILGFAGGKPANPISAQVTVYVLYGTCILAYVGMLPALVYLIVWKPSRRQLKGQTNIRDL